VPEAMKPRTIPVKANAGDGKVIEAKKAA
jgi:hypothetical protein